MITEQDRMYAKKFLKTFGSRIAAGRKAKGLTQVEFAKRAGLAPTYVSSIETGRRWPHLNIIWDIAEELDTTPDKLVAGIEDEIGWH